MLRDPELLMLLDQAARNLSTLELLARAAKEHDLTALQELQQRLGELKEAYTKETDSLTHQVLKRAVERRRMADRRRGTSALPGGGSVGPPLH